MNQEQMSQRLYMECASHGTPHAVTFFAPHGKLHLHGPDRGGRTPYALVQWRKVDGDRVYLEVGHEWREAGVAHCERERFYVEAAFVRHAVDRARWFCMFGALGNAEHLRPYREATDLFSTPQGPPT